MVHSWIIMFEEGDFCFMLSPMSEFTCGVWMVNDFLFVTSYVIVREILEWWPNLFGHWYYYIFVGPISSHDFPFLHAIFLCGCCSCAWVLGTTFVHEFHNFIAMMGALTLVILCSGKVSGIWEEKFIEFSRFVPLMPIMLNYRQVL